MRAPRLVLWLILLLLLISLPSLLACVPVPCGVGPAHPLALRVPACTGPPMITPTPSV